MFLLEFKLIIDHLNLDRKVCFILLLCLGFIFKGFSQKKDTLVRTFWTNGNQKTVTVYKLDHIKDSAGHTITLLKDIKSVKYYKATTDMDTDEQREISKKEFEEDCRQEAKWDSIVAKRKADHGKRSIQNVLVFNLGSGPRKIPFRVDLGDSAKYSSEKSDTLVAGDHYTYQVYLKDSLTNKMVLFKAFGNDSMQIYCYSYATQEKEVVFDLRALMAKATVGLLKRAAIIGSATFRTVDAGSRAARSAAGKSAGFLLGNIILIAR